jgi:hypothetical protein
MVVVEKKGSTYLRQSIFYMWATSTHKLLQGALTFIFLFLFI